MGWRSIVYGDANEVRDTVMEWAEYRTIPLKQISVTSKEIMTSDHPEECSGAYIEIRCRISKQLILELRERLVRGPSSRIYIWFDSSG